MNNAQIHTNVNYLPQAKSGEVRVPMFRRDFIESNQALNQQNQNTEDSSNDLWGLWDYGNEVWGFIEEETVGEGIFSIFYETDSGPVPKYKVSHNRPVSLAIGEQSIYPIAQFISGFLTTDMFCNIPAFVRYWKSSYQRLPKYSISQEDKKHENGYNATGNRMFSVISRHPEMAASSGTFIVAAWFGTEWRPIAIEDSPAMEYGVFRNLYTYAVDESEKIWDGQIYLEPWS